MRSSFVHSVLVVGSMLVVVACNEPSSSTGGVATSGAAAPPTAGSSIVAAGAAGPSPAGSVSAAGAAGMGVAGSAGVAASPTASATLAPLGGASQLSGSAIFTKVPWGITLAISVANCSDGKSYAVHIHDGTSCADDTSQGGYWGAAANAAASGNAAPGVLRGEGIPDIVCSGSTGTGMYTRSTPDIRAAWTMGVGGVTDVLGHVVVVHDGSTRVACGQIVLK